MSDPSFFSTVISHSPPPPHQRQPPPSDSKHTRRSGVFFQLLDWNRRFNAKRLLSNRLLPADRPSKQPTTTSQKDDKLPMAKLLLIADENRGGFPKVGQGSREGETGLAKEKTPERKKKSKRNPNVVAKLMGLEAMPSPEPPKDKEKRNVDENTHPNDDKFFNFTAHNPPDEKPVSMRSSRTLACQKSDDFRSPMFFYKLPALSPRKAEHPFRSILSPSKAHNRLLSPIKSPLGTKRLFEAAVKILEPGVQPGSRVRNIGIISRPSKSMLVEGNCEEKKSGNNRIAHVTPSSLRRKPPVSAPDTKKQRQGIPTSRLYPDQSNVQKKLKHGRKPTNVCHSSATHRPQVGCSIRQENTADDVPEMSGAAPKEEAVTSSSQPHSRRQFRNKNSKCDSCELKTAKDVKPEVDARKQQSRARPAVGGKKRVSGPNQGADMALKGSIVLIETTDSAAALPQSNNDDDSDCPRRSSTDSMVSPSSSSGILNYGRLFSSRKSSEITECSKKKGDSSLMKSFLRKKGGSTETTTKREPRKVASISSKKVSNKNKDPSSSITVNSSDERENSASGSNELSCTTSSTGSKRVPSGTTAIDDYMPPIMSSEHNMASSFLEAANSAGVTTENSMHSSIFSSAGDCVDSATSLEAGHHSKRAVSYAGKTTAAILQELLTALNSSKTPITLEDQLQSLSDNSDCASSSDAMFTPPAASAKFCSGRYASGFKDGSLSSEEIPRRVKRLSSPISTLEPPFDDDYSISESLNNSAQDSVSEIIIQQSDQPDFVLRSHNIDISSLGFPSKAVDVANECEERYVRAIMGGANMSPINVYCAMLRLPCTILDSAMFKTLEDRYHQQWEWGIKQDMMNVSSNHAHEEVGAQNRRLIFDCTNEALNLNLGITEVQESQQGFPQHLSLSPAFHLKSVCRQINAWREMCCGMNVDDMVEKDMSEGTGKWTDLSHQVSDLTLEMEAGITKGLIDELVHDLSRIQATKQDSNKKQMYLRNYVHDWKLPRDTHVKKI